jgi:peptide deformylase
MKLVPCDSAFLKLKTKPVEFFNSTQKAEIDDMIALMHKENGVGLSANQVGINKSIFVIDVPFAIQDNDKLSKQTVSRTMINPVLELSGEDIAIEEGCLSFPGKLVKVSRKQICKVKYQNIFGRWVEEDYNNLIAIVIQHEYDHLLGVSMVDYEKPQEQSGMQAWLDNQHK